MLRGAVCDYARAVQFAQRLCKASITGTVLHGISFSGALALMAAALLGAADLLAIGVPLGRRSQLFREGSDILIHGNYDEPTN